MADKVWFRLERMADELDDLNRRGLFSRAEIAEIVRRRRDFEYRLRRPGPLKEDFLAYVDYECQVDALRVLRKRAIVGGGGKEGKVVDKGNKSISDVAGVRRIMDIYKLATVKHRGDLDLWFRYLEFCRTRRNGRMKKVLAQAIKYHPKVPGIWIYAAAWEFDQNLNVAAARALMQSGLRSCPKSEELWIEYLRMELTYLNKLKARKVALGEDVKTLSHKKSDASDWKAENKDLFMFLSERVEDVEELDSQQGALKKEDVFWKQGLLILQTIYDGAVEALPTSLSLRKRFLEFLDSVDLAHSDELKIKVIDDLKRDFSDEEDYWDWFARYQIKDAPNHDGSNAMGILLRSIQVYEDALRRLPTQKMFSQYIKFLLEAAFPDNENSLPLLCNTAANVSELTSSILEVFEKAESNECLTEDLACKYISFYMQTNRIEEARTLASKFCNGPCSSSGTAWLLRTTMETKYLMNKQLSLRQEDLSSLFDLFKGAFVKLSLSQAEKLWIMAINLFADKKDFFEKLVKSLIPSLSIDRGSSSGASVPSAIIGSVLQRSGLQEARKLYKRFLGLPHPSLQLFKFCIELERNLISAGQQDALPRVRKLYESALIHYSQDPELWKDFYKMESMVGTSETANAVYWRARKMLKDTAALSMSAQGL